jgi:hypothetical protein
MCCDFDLLRAIGALRDFDWKYAVGCFHDLYSDHVSASSRGYYSGSAIGWSHDLFCHDLVERPEQLFRRQVAQRKLLLIGLR